MMRDKDLAIETGMVDETYRQGVYGYSTDVAVSRSLPQKPDHISPQAESLPNYRQLCGPWWKFGSGDRGLGRVDLAGLNVRACGLPRAVSQCNILTGECPTGPLQVIVENMMVFDHATQERATRQSMRGTGIYTKAVSSHNSINRLLL